MNCALVVLGGEADLGFDRGAGDLLAVERSPIEQDGGVPPESLAEDDEVLERQLVPQARRGGAGAPHAARGETTIVGATAR